MAKRLQELERQVQDLRKALEASQQPKPAEPAPAAKPPAQPPDEAAERLDEQEKKIDSLTSRVDELKLGTEKFLLSGYVSAGITAPQHGNSQFNAAFTPVFLWKLSDNLLAAGAVEFELEDNDTKVNLEYANLNWTATDWLTLRGGVLLHPLSTFQEQLHPAWINKLPDKPLFAGERGIAPEEGLGFEARGGFRTGMGKITYSAFVTNGPSLITSGDRAGQLELRDFSDVNSNKAFGGRIGYLPLPELEFSYAVMFNNVTPSDSGLSDISLVTHDLGVSYVAEKDWLYGRIDARAEFVIADFQDKVDLGSGPFNDDRAGGYVQVAYRPTKAGDILKNFEPVVRWDFLNQPGGAPDPADETRWTVGLNYWINPRTVIKAAYEFDHVKDPSGARQSNNALMIQAAMGF
ncbi:MAG: hypothetical protein WC718_02840 [Phycisphaerales bacterium]